MTIGASWSAQFVAAAGAFAFGLAGGIFALLFKRKAQPLERAIVDFFAVAAMTALFLTSAELTASGRIAWYTIVFYLLGALCTYRAESRLKARFTLKKSADTGNSARKFSFLKRRKKTGGR